MSQQTLTFSILPFQSVIVGASSLSPSGITASFFPITDTSVHTYRTDPNYIKLISIGNAMPPIRAFSVYILNNENQPLTVSFLANIVNDQSLPDVTLTLPDGSTSATIDAGTAGEFSFNFDAYFVQYFSVALQYSTAPTAAELSQYPFGVFGMLFTSVGV